VHKRDNCGTPAGELRAS